MDKMIPKNLNELHILNRKYEYILSNGRNYYEYFNPHERQKIACRFRNSSYNFDIKVNGNFHMSNDEEIIWDEGMKLFSEYFNGLWN